MPVEVVRDAEQIEESLDQLTTSPNLSKLERRKKLAFSTTDEFVSALITADLELADSKVSFPIYHVLNKENYNIFSSKIMFQRIYENFYSNLKSTSTLEIDTDDHVQQFSSFIINVMGDASGLDESIYQAFGVSSDALVVSVELKLDNKSLKNLHFFFDEVEGELLMRSFWMVDTGQASD